MKIKQLRLKVTASLLVAIIVLTGFGVFASCEDGIIAPPPEAYPSSLVPTTNGTLDMGTATKQWRDLYLYRYILTSGGTYTLTLPTTTDTLVGRTTTDTLTNKTINGLTMGGTWAGAPTVTGNWTVSGNWTNSGNPTFSGTPNFTGTPTFANRASGTSNISASATTLYIAHGLSSTPTRVFFSWGINPGTSTDSAGINFFSWSANSTNITITAALSTNVTAACYWLALISDE